MRVGITGASGFVGTALTEEGKRRDWQVITYSRRAWASGQGEGTLRTLATQEAVDLSGLDALVHLAGAPIATLWTARNRRRIRESRVGLTEELVKLIAAQAAENRPKVLISASACGYYGNRGDDRLDEESDPGFGFLSELCRDWEAAAEKAKGLGVRVVILRIGLVLGQGGLLRRLRPVYRACLGGRLGNGRQWMSWIHISDLVGLIAECIENPLLHGPVNAVAPNPVQNREFTATYARTLGRKAWFPVPSLLLIAQPGGMGHLFLDSQRVEPTVALAHGFAYRYSDLESALRAVESDIISAQTEQAMRSELQS